MTFIITCTRDQNVHPRTRGFSLCTRVNDAQVICTRISVWVDISHFGFLFPSQNNDYRVENDTIWLIFLRAPLALTNAINVFFLNIFFIVSTQNRPKNFCFFIRYFFFYLYFFYVSFFQPVPQSSADPRHPGRLRHHRRPPRCASCMPWRPANSISSIRDCSNCPTDTADTRKSLITCSINKVPLPSYWVKKHKTIIYY